MAYRRRGYRSTRRRRGSSYRSRPRARKRGRRRIRSYSASRGGVRL